jgi:pimeloyl-ACP methyl ester carboxylesterase
MFRFGSGLVVLFMLFHPVLTAKPATADPLATWVGSCRIDGRDVFVRLHLRDAAGRTTGFAFSRPLGIRNAPLADVQTDADQLAGSFQIPHGTVRLSCTIRDDKLVGTAEFGGESGACSFRRRQDMDAAAFDAFAGDYQLTPDHVVFIGRYATPNYLFLAEGDRRIEIVPVGPREFLADDLRTVTFEIDEGAKVVAAVITPPSQTPQRASRVSLYRQEPVTFSSRDVCLSGTLTLPPGPGPHPALVFVHGSGPTPRAFHSVEADLFARHGIATLAFDKRGTGESTGDWRCADFDDLADDVLAGVQFMRRDSRIQPGKVGLWGISQAAWVMAAAAARSPEVAFIVPISGGAVTPAEQELWRHRQNLESLGVPERFIELERKGAAMAYQWQREHQLGRMPIPNPFTDDNLNMFHDATAVMPRIRQPVLAIFGGSDSVTPPRESAALWAHSLRERGNGDFSVRLFPHGSHGLDDVKTGSPHEIQPERRWVPGYFDTVVQWIHHHTGGPEFAEARQIDVDPEIIPGESRGMHQVSWYGSGLVQPWQLLFFVVVFASAAMAAPAISLWRKLHRVQDLPHIPMRRTQWLAALSGFLNIGILITFTYIVYQLVQAVPNPIFTSLGLIWNSLAIATWLSLVLVLLVCYSCLAAWRHGRGSRAGRIYYTLVTLVSLTWIPFVIYWDLVRPAF